MRAKEYVVHRHCALELPVHGLHDTGIYQSIPDIGLIGHDDDDKAGLLERFHRPRGMRQEPEVSETPRRIRLAVTDFTSVEHAIAVEKDGANRTGRQ
jgi:hypothetical protein